MKLVALPDWRGGRIAGVGAVVSVVWLRCTPAAAGLHGPAGRRGAASAAAR